MLNNFFEALKQLQEEEQNPAQQFNPQDFIKEENIKEDEVRADGRKTAWFDLNQPNTNRKKTSYSTEEGLHKTAVGVDVLTNKNVKLNGNAYQWKDSEYGYCDIYAANIDQIKQYGTGKASVYNSSLYGTVIEVTDSKGNKSNGIILDSCGAASKEAILDKFTKKTELENEYISWQVKRKGFKNKNDDPRY